MSSSTWTKARSGLLVPVLVLSLALAPQLLRSTPAVAAPTAQTYMSTCGLVSNYSFTPGGTANGTITVGSQTFTLLAGTTFTGPAAASVANGANLCFQFTLNSANQVTAATVYTPTYVPGTMQICGQVTAFTAATSGAAGSITVAGQTLTIMAGTVGTGMAVTTGTSYCIVFTINAAGQIVAFRVGQNLPGVPIVCGVFTAFVPAVGVAQAFILVNGFPFPVNTAVFVPTFLVRSQVVCFALSTSGFIVGFLSGVPTLAAPVEGAGDSAYRMGRLLAR